jgi:ubiquitin-conjugating enzyme E2 Z
MGLPQTNRRVMMDMKVIQSEETKSLRIFYQQNEDNLYKGIALIFGPGETIYHNLPVLLEIEFPQDYPFSNPKVKFLTSDGRTRFHPNLYVEGKVCLSILGTWQGPSWTSVMTLRTVLLSIMGLLDEEPLLHEPGYASYKGKPISKQYSEFIEHSVLRYIVHTIHKYSEGVMDNSLKKFESVWCEELSNVYKDTLVKLQKYAIEPQKIWNNLPYSMNGISEYPSLLEKCLAAGTKLRIKID